MKPLQLLPIGEGTDGLLDFLQSAMQQSLGVRCEVVPAALDPAPTFHVERRQYHSSEILARMQNLAGPQCWRLLGIADVDLYIPILTFVFGEAQMRGPCAVYQRGAFGRNSTASPRTETCSSSGCSRKQSMKSDIHAI
jgi:archaemetzincin